MARAIYDFQREYKSMEAEIIQAIKDSVNRFADANDPPLEDDETVPPSPATDFVKMLKGQFVLISSS